MVASGRGVAALPRWLVKQYENTLGVVPAQLWPSGHRQADFYRNA
jgi:LysR family transcriptional regulator for metE and metH